MSIIDSTERRGRYISSEVWTEEPRTDLDWQDDALCAQVGSEMFFPDKGGSTKDAKQVCTSCDVREQCLLYALKHKERFGIWGGLSERERRAIIRSTRQEAA